MLGPESLEAPLVSPTRRSVSFADTGFHVLRCGDGGSFAAFRCGTIRDRFSQIDMLHVDLWWRGHNVLVDGGSYLYNGPPVWNQHFTRTAVHNTLTVDGNDQMLHYRQFKVLYWTRCRILDFQNHDGYALCGGEHYGYRRQPGGCVHRRFVLQVGHGLWVVVDRVSGDGEHALRLHWLGGEFPHRQQGGLARMALQTPSGEFSLTVVDEQGRVVPGDVVAGREDPPRGWCSRYYGELAAVPSLAVNRAGRLPLTLVSILGAGDAAWEVQGGAWTVAGGGQRARFRIVEGRLTEVRVDGPNS
jgi:asparagine synthase (glutamine-hydrolysing)